MVGGGHPDLSGVQIKTIPKRGFALTVLLPAYVCTFTCVCVCVSVCVWSSARPAAGWLAGWLAEIFSDNRKKLFTLQNTSLKNQFKRNIKMK